VTKTQSAGPISCLEHRATRVLHCAIVTTAAVLMFPLLLQTYYPTRVQICCFLKSKSQTGLRSVEPFLYSPLACLTDLQKPRLSLVIVCFSYIRRGRIISGIFYSATNNRTVAFSVMRRGNKSVICVAQCFFRCFDAVVWAAGRASGLQKTLGGCGGRR